MARDKILTFRVRRLPLQIDKAEATRFIQEAVGADDTTVTVESLAVDLALPDIARSKTATVTIDPVPPCLEEEDELSFRTSYAESECIIIIDRRFLGFTALSDVDASEHVLDCIAISGLGSHPFGSWQHRGNGPPFMWLRDGLPKDLPGVRTIIYGYDSHVAGSSSFQRIYDLSRNLINGLTSFGFGTSTSRPIVFMAHSLGGLILKETLVNLAAYSDQQFSVIRNVRSVINFGVPHKGMETSQLLTMVNGQPNEQLIQDLTPKSSYLECIENLFNGIQHFNRFAVVSFYETETTKTVAWDGKRWSGTGGKIAMVDPDSAIQRSSRPDEKCAVDEDHSSMVKFARGDVNYQRVLDYVRRSTLWPRSKIWVGTQSSEQGRVLDSSGEPSGMRTSEAQYHSHEEPFHREERKSKRKTFSYKEIVQSLNLDVFTRRETEIALNSPSTYQWVFQNEDLKIIQWFLKKEGVYWIHGKPGSGKSTLLKYIFSHKQTLEALQQWRRSAKLIKAGFFFYYRGSSMQKTLYGLMRSVLFQILFQVPELHDEIPRHCPSKDKNSQIEWTFPNLQDTLRAIFNQQRLELGICLFVDALDEFDGHLESLSEFIESMITPTDSTKLRVKVIFTSRPRDILFNRFKHFPNFQLQEHTKGDIERYTMERLNRFPGARNQMEPSRTAPQPLSEVLEYINQTADGVFLWVRLALDRLFEAVTAQDPLTALDMNRFLRELPTELGDFYADIIRRIPQDFRWNAYLIFDSLLKALDEPRLVELHLIVVYSKCQTIQECDSRQTKLESFPNFCTQLREQCGGLIELEKPFQLYHTVRLMHETVREFVSQPAFRELIVGREALFRSQNGYTELAKLRHCTQFISRSDTREVPAHATYHHLAEITTGACQFRFIDSLGGRINLTVGSLPDDPLTFAVYYGFSLFVQESLSKSEEPKLYEDKALFHAVCLAANRFEAAYIKLGSSSKSHSEYKPDYIRVTELLINKGLRMTSYKGTHPLGNLLYYPDRDIDQIAQLYRSPGIMEMAQLLLDNGQDPNASSALVGRLDVTPWVCRPLHLAVSPMTEILLRYGADINGRDEKGRTPIDTMIRRIAKYQGYEGLAFVLTHSFDVDKRMSVVARNISVLTERGLIARAGLIHLLECQSSWKSTPHIQEMIEKSFKEGIISLADLWMAKFAVGIKKLGAVIQRKSMTQLLREEKDYC